MLVKLRKQVQIDMSYIPAQMRQRVVVRAESRCEYCRLSQANQEAAFHIDHIKPKSAGGQTILENLALACVSCSLRKAARRDAIDPETGAKVSFYNPRKNEWSNHFEVDDGHIFGKSPKGRATVISLAMNRLLAVAIRREEIAAGRYRP